MLHVPKTGGTSLHTAFWPGSPTSHGYPSDCDEERWRKYFVWGFVRHPYTRLASAYVHLTGRYNGRILNQYPDLKSYSFEQIVREVYGENSQPWAASQVDLLTRPDGKRVDFIGRFERWNEDVQYVLQRLGSAPEIKHKNSNSGTSYEEILSASVKKAIVDVFECDFEAFGYQA